MVTRDSTDSLIYNLRDNIFFWARGFFTTGKQFCCTSEGQPKNENNLLDRKEMYWERMEGKKSSLYCYQENYTWYCSASSHVSKIQPVYRLTPFFVKHLKIYTQVLRSNTTISCQSYYHQNSIFLLKLDM